MRGRLAAVIWLAIGVAIWNGFYDLYVSRGAREYLQLAAEAELGRREPPSMSAVMASNSRAGAYAATVWAVLIVGAGWATLKWGRKT
jgi:hypothetical protein